MARGTSNRQIAPHDLAEVCGGLNDQNPNEGQFRMTKASLPELAYQPRDCAVCGKLTIRLSRLPGHGWEMSIPDEDYWYAALPLSRDADRDAALANVRRRFPDAFIEIPGNVAQ
jgi:hypothetical protein